MVLRPSDLPADETPEMEMDFAADNPQTVSGGVDMGRRRFLQVVLTGAGYAAVNNVIAEEPTVGKGSNTKVQPVVVTKVSEEAQAKRELAKKLTVQKPSEDGPIEDWPIKGGRNSKFAEYYFHLHHADPGKNVFIYPANSKERIKDWGPSGKTIPRSGTRLIVFQLVEVMQRDTKGKPMKVAVPEKRWMFIGTNDKIPNIDPNGNPFNIHHSDMLFEDPKDSAALVDKLIAQISVDSDAVAKKNKLP